ncbi:MAG: DMT family transporter [Casimicrobiaceae bacterium]
MTPNNAKRVPSSASPAIGALFVLLWSTGFIGAKLGLPYAEPLTFLALRMALVVALLLVVALVTQAPWPVGRRAWIDVIIAGLLVQCGYLGGVFSAIYHGMHAGVAALIVGLQPLLTAVGAALFLGERSTRMQWVGLMLGFVGVALVVSNGLGSEGVTKLSLALATLALLSITAGTIYQKRFGAAMDFRTGGIIQYTATGAVLFVLAMMTESMHVTWSAQFVFALAWLVLVLSIGAISLLFVLIKRGKATAVSSLFYLTPPVTAIMAYLLFGEVLTPIALAGMVIAVVGVALVNR